MIEPEHLQLSIRRQCELVGLNRSTFYYTPVPESDFNLHLMRLIDAQYTQAPFYGRRRMTAYLRREGYEVNPKRVQQLMQKMGLQAIYPKPRTSIAAKGHKVYPYLLRNRSAELTTKPGHRAAQPGVERRHHLHPYATWFYVPHRDHRLV
jgi:putative transposase